MADRYSERAGGRWDEGDRRFRDRDYGDGDRNFLERFADEVRSWFGDEEAQRRRMRDEREDWRTRGDWASREWSRGDWSRSNRGDWMRTPDEREWSRERDWDREPRARQSREFGWGHVGMGGFGRGDAMTAASYAGRGPRNYQRTDERIREDICERLTQHSYLDPSDVEIRVQNGDVTLDGTVNDRWAKRTAEDLAEGVWGVKSVHNIIRVVMTEPGQEFRSGERQPGQAEHGRPPRRTWAA
jgi:hypothetical protein